ncbi:hypothetical protein Pmani_016727 [Petrolisthes manimaculis]|uniref:Uncharacterized protein n=1 Tax=Petrolisthes manimaculis TaxID=1843537 RepID=A0AAE1PNB4_9EUCA|nr:hypothetical protein Pmani_016727 [Petrolisthes manimaculis]
MLLIDLQKMMWCGHFLLSLAVGICHWHLLQGFPPPPPPPTSLLSQLASSSLPSTTNNNRRSPRSPPAGPCAAKSLKTWVTGEKESREREIKEGEEQHNSLSLQYSIDVENPENCSGPPICDGEEMKLLPVCREFTYYLQFQPGFQTTLSPQVNGSVAVCWGDCAELSCGNLKSRYHLPPLLQLRGDVTLRSSSLMLVPLVEKRFPSWVKMVLVRVVVVDGDVAALLNITQHTSLLEIPGTFGQYNYTIMYKLVSECEGDGYKTLVEAMPLQVPKKLPTSISLGLVILLVVLVVVVVGIILTTVLLRRKRRQSHRLRLTRPSYKLHRSNGDILLIHGTDGPQEVSKSHVLKQKVTEYCNRQVRDLCDLNDPEFVDDPSTWLLNTMTQREEVTVMLVLTPAITNVIIQLTTQDANAQELQVMNTLDRGLLIYDCLRTLQNDPKRYFHRLVLVRLDEGRATDNNDLLSFTPRRPFLIYKEEDQQNLLAALHPDPSHTPTHKSSSTSLI